MYDSDAHFRCASEKDVDMSEQSVRITLNIDGELLDKVVESTGEKTKQERS